MNVLVWFKRDLRVHDHPALARAAALGPVLPVYIVEPGLWAGPDAAGRHWAHLTEALADLREDLGACGASLGGAHRRCGRGSGAAVPGAWDFANPQP